MHYFFSIPALLFALSSAAPSPPRGSPQPQAQSLKRGTWQDWSSIETLFTFGNSWTDTGFKTTDTAPSPSNPLGNSNIDPTAPFHRSTWATYLTTRDNDSIIENYNLAVSFATVSNAIIPHTVDDLVSQSKKFVYTYGSKKDSAGGEGGVEGSWNCETSLFAILIGVNDVEIQNSNKSLVGAGKNEQIFATYAEIVDRLYGAGGRNFLFLNAPPMQIAPLAENVSNLKSIVGDWNRRLDAMATALVESHGDASVFVFKTEELFARIVEDPGQFGDTKGIKNVTGKCDKYQDYKGADTGFYDESCGSARLGEYFWRDGLHPLFPVQRAISAQVAEGLRGRGELVVRVGEGTGGGLEGEGLVQDGQEEEQVQVRRRRIIRRWG